MKQVAKNISNLSKIAVRNHYLIQLPHANKAARLIIEPPFHARLNPQLDESRSVFQFG